MPEALRPRFASLLPSRVVAVPALALLVGLALACQGSSESRMTEIQAMQQAGEFGETIEPLRDILATNPDDPDANYLLGVALLQTGRSSQAIFPLQKAAQSEEHGVSAGVTLAATLFNTENYERAIQAATEVLEKDPELVTALYVRAHAAVATGKPEMALEDAERVLEIAPDDFKAHTLKAGALVDLERYDEAEQVHHRLGELAEQMGDPDTQARACAALGNFYFGRDMEEKATAQFESCLERFPTHGFVLQTASDFYDETGREETGNAAWRNAIEQLPDAFGLRTQLASRLEEQGRLDEAEALLLETAELFDTGQAWYELSRMRHRASDLDGALEAIDRAVERAGRRASESLHFLHADLLVTAGELERAEAIAEEHLEHREYRDVVEAHAELARGNAAHALSMLEDVLVLWPNNTGARHLAGRAAEQVGDYEKAINQYKEAYRSNQSATDAALSIARIQLARGEYEDAIGWVRADLNRRPAGRAEALVLGSRIAAARGRLENARSLLDRAAKTEGADPREITLERIALTRRTEGPEAALAVLRESDLDPTDPENVRALAGLADDLLALDRGDEALARVDEALEAHPDEAALHDLRARVLLRLDRAEEAGAAFDRALAAEAGFAPALQGQAALALAAGDPERALDLATRALTADPQYADAAYTGAQAHLVAGRADEARAWLRRTLAIEPSHAAASNDLAWLLAQAGEDLDRALSLAQRAVAQAPQPETYDTLGWVHLRRGDAQAAVEALDESLRLRESPSVRYRLGLALADAGDEGGARQAFEKALSGGDFPESEAARSQLARLEKR